jgi:hypothetical protein
LGKKNRPKKPWRMSKDLNIKNVIKNLYTISKGFGTYVLIDFTHIYKKSLHHLQGDSYVCMYTFTYMYKKALNHFKGMYKFTYMYASVHLYKFTYISVHVYHFRYTSVHLHKVT